VTSRWEEWRRLDPATPVVVGVGTATQHLVEPGAGRDALQLMIDACRAAGADSGAGALLGAVDVVAVPGGSWSYRDPGRLVATAIGSPRARTVLVAAGIPQQTLLDDALVDIRAGRTAVAVVVGGEAAFRELTARRAGVALPDDPPVDGEPDELRRPDGELVTPIEIAARMYSPPLAYALIDSALRAAEGRSLEAHRDEIAALWAGFSAVAGRFGEAAFREPRSAAFLRDPGPENRPVAFPYNKWHCSQMHVDQAAAILLCGLGVAEASGVDPDRVVFPLVALESSSALALPRRRDLHRWPAMELLGARAAEHLGAPLSAVEHAEVYSCFPAAVRVQQRALGLPLDGVPTITGGEPFAGGPWNNFVLQSSAAMIRLLRRERGARGLVTTVSGFLHKPGLAVYSTDPGTRPLLVADLGAEAARATPAVDIVEDHHGPATVAAYTVSAERSGDRVLVVLDTPSGARCVAASSDAALAVRVTTDDLIGCEVHVDGGEFRL
jgi:acetyl-CoA C-acetyltransferase